jgi:glutamate N-acetyltransferase/amino-acid N-acetyltransferase
LVNAGCANACTGAAGMKNARATAAQIARRLNCSADEILLCSTGVIGHQLDLKKMSAGIDRLLDGEGGAGADFSRAIMTTDTRPKAALITLANGVKIAGVCKGSGMIAPKMATMLAFILTDAKIGAAPLQEALSAVAEETFNRVTVDGDTSTNDTLLLLASGAAGKSGEIKSRGAVEEFRAGLYQVCLSLAEQIAADGEGATKLVRVSVNGAKSDADAERGARAVAESPLVKTAMFGNDPNWGRIICALGYSGAAFDEARATISLCGKIIFKHGAPQKFAAAALSQKMRAKEVDIVADFGLGKGAAQILTCDFSYDYVKINADYHT